MSDKQWGHDELASDLADYLRADTRQMVWEDMQLGPSGSARPDVYSMQKSYSRFAPMVYEVKVSTSDFRSDVTSGKWQKYLKFSSGVYFAAPAGLLKKSDIPDRCGLIERKEKVWRRTKKPVLQALDHLPLTAWIKLLIDGVERCVVERNIRYADHYTARQILCNKTGKELAAMLSDVDFAERRLKQKIAQLEAEEKKTDEQIKAIHDGRVRRAETRLAEIDREINSIKMLFGLEPNAGHYELYDAIRNARNLLDKDAEVEALNKSLQSIEHVFAENKKRRLENTDYIEVEQ